MTHFNEYNIGIGHECLTCGNRMLSVADYLDDRIAELTEELANVRMELAAKRDQVSALESLCQEAAVVLERTANDTLDGRNMAESLREQSTSGLARLKAKWQAEVLAEWTHGSRIMPATLNLAMSKRRKELEAIAAGIM